MAAKRTWSPEQIRFQEWLALPRQMRQPATQEALAEELGVHWVTLSKWKKREGFMEAVSELARRHLIAALPDVYGSLVDEAVRGDVAAIKLYLQLLGEVTERSQIEVVGPRGGAVGLTVVPVDYRHQLAQMQVTAEDTPLLDVSAEA